MNLTRKGGLLLDLLYKNEKKLFVMSLIISILFWTVLIIGTFGIALIYILFFYIFYLFAQSALISYIKGTGAKIDDQQYPDLYDQFQACAKKLDMEKMPDCYLLHADGIFNAFATRFLKRYYIVLYSDIVDALDKYKPALNFYIGHELGHIHSRHIFWNPILFPALVLPLLGAGYSRAREYTCDNYGYACCEEPKAAIAGLAALSVGSQRWKTISIKNYVDQTLETGGFWMSFHELVADYPWLVKRMARIYYKAANIPSVIPRRNIFAWLLALFVPRTFGAAGGGSIIVVIAIIGILAAIAIPNFISYRDKAYQTNVRTELSVLMNAEGEYFQSYGRYTVNLDDLNYAAANPKVNVEILSADEDCYQAKGTMDEMRNDIWIDCNGNEQLTEKGTSADIATFKE